VDDLFCEEGGGRDAGIGTKKFLGKEFVSGKKEERRF
jgi:hypothetical protein